MKVIAIKSKESVIASLTVEELLNLAGFGLSEQFNSLVGYKATHYGTTLDMDERGLGKLIECEIPVSEIYADAKETLRAYGELKTKMESIKNQLTILTAKMNREPQKKGANK